MTMVLRVEDHLDVWRDNRRWRDLRRALRTAPEPERLAFILRLMDFHPTLGWGLANACMRRRDLVEQVFQRSFPVVGAGPNHMGLLLRRLVPRLGVRRIVQILFAALETHPQAVDAALYFLPRYVSPHSRREQYAVEQLWQAAEARGIIKGPIRIAVSPKP